MIFCPSTGFGGLPLMLKSLTGHKVLVFEDPGSQTAVSMYPQIGYKQKWPGSLGPGACLPWRHVHLRVCSFCLLPPQCKL